MADAASIAVLSVKGITCLDCAAKFERSVAALPGVTSALLNTATGELRVEGALDLAAIRREGQKENYVILAPMEADASVERDVTAERRRAELYRMGGAGLLLLVGYGLVWAGGSSDLPAPAGPLEPLHLAALTGAILLGGWTNFKKAFYAIRSFSLTMAVLMTVAIIGAVLIGEWEEAAVVAFLYAVSEFLEAWTQARANRSLRQLIELAPKRARVSRHGEAVEVSVEAVGVGELVLIRPGEQIALDGLVLSGLSAVNQAAVTGESVPVEKGPGDEVFAGTLNTTGALAVKVTKPAGESTIAKVIELVQAAQTKKAPTQAFVDRFAAVYTPIVMGLALLVILLPPLLMGAAWAPWIYRGLSLLVVACPCALVVSTPVSIVAAISNAAKHGVLIKGGVYLEAAGRLKAIAFDKTGTLTVGAPVLTDLVLLGETGSVDTGSADADAGARAAEAAVLRQAAAIEASSEHPLAKAIVTAARERGLAIPVAEGMRALVGEGATASVEGEPLYVGNQRLFSGLGLDLAPHQALIERLQGEGKTVILCGSSTELRALLAVADQIRPTSQATLAALKEAGIGTTVMLTGDNERTAKAVAAAVGVDQYRAELLPDQKAAAVEALLAEHGTVAMVGDGINDAPALATASLGVAMGGAGSGAALETAQIVLMADDLAKLPFTVRLSRAALAVIRANIAFSILIKVIAIGLVFPGWLSLWIAILADTGATVIVTLNSMRLLRVRP
ncbi:MAG TPA: heavy metal translocating P-type ATPase [Symbiobacteriaceae bacterium]|nr:heavy metal translocating P-type ATPase [Symbiobacteriaceae bacterium]